MADTAKHTPGPWGVFSRIGVDGLPEVIVTASNGCPLGAVSNHAEYRENARLIAAAPDLLEALYAADLMLQDHKMSLPQVKAAIAKAEARS